MGGPPKSGIVQRIRAFANPPAEPPPPVAVPRQSDHERADFHIGRFNRAIAQFDPAKGPERLAELERWRDYWTGVRALGPRPE